MVDEQTIVTDKAQCQADGHKTMQKALKLVSDPKMVKNYEIICTTDSEVQIPVPKVRPL